jgi:Ca2+-binding RTX toxin-like protein
MEGNDTYVFDTDSVLGSDTIDELSAEGGVDTLDFSGTSTRGISVSLSNAWSQWVNVNLSLNLSAINTIENMIGGALNDTLIGNSLANRLNGNTGDDILSGGAGNDILIGDVGKNMLIGGDGADQLLTGSGEDVLLGARYWYEDDTVALGALLSEWISASSFDDRVAHLRGLLDGGTNNGFTFSQSTVREDSVRDTLSGGNGRDWYLRNSTGGSPLWYDVIEDPNLDSLFTEIALWL